MSTSILDFDTDGKRLWAQTCQNKRSQKTTLRKTIYLVTTSIYLKCLHLNMFWKALHQSFLKIQIISGEYSQENSSFFSDLAHVPKVAQNRSKTGYEHHIEGKLEFYMKV